MLVKDSSWPSKSGRHWTPVMLTQPRLVWAVPQLGTAAVCFWRDAALCVLEKSIWGDFSPSLLYFRKQYWCWLWPFYLRVSFHKTYTSIKPLSAESALGHSQWTANTIIPTYDIHGSLSHWLPCTLIKTATWSCCHIQASGSTRRPGHGHRQAVGSSHSQPERQGPWFSSMPTGKDAFTTSQSSSCLHLWQQQDMSPVGGLGQTKFQYWRNFNGCAFKTFWGWG